MLHKFFPLHSSHSIPHAQSESQVLTLHTDCPATRRFFSKGIWLA